MDLFDAKSAALITQLQRQQVAYLLVGGYAVNIHGYSRGTGDMDIWIRPTADNVLRSLRLRCNRPGRIRTPGAYAGPFVARHRRTLYS